MAQGLQQMLCVGNGIEILPLVLLQYKRFLLRLLLILILIIVIVIIIIVIIIVIIIIILLLLLLLTPFVDHQRQFF